MSAKVGVWIVGAKGGVATTAICGALAIRRGMVDAVGMVTESDACVGLGLPTLHDLAFGGHDIRESGLTEQAHELRRDASTLRYETIQELTEELDTISKSCRPGVLFESGQAIEALADGTERYRVARAREAVDRIAADIREFKSNHNLERVVLVNLASTEPQLETCPELDTAEGVMKLVESDDHGHLRASTLYAVAGAETDCSYLNFTPSPGALPAGIAALFEQRGLPFMGSDGKTGETLMKSVLATLFHQRRLRVLAWQGYNMLGDRDGQVLQNESNKAAKVESKDHLLQEHLGYPFQSHVAIDYVPSLNDWKTAWDFIHFEGFLGVKMSLQFTWQGCDSILAAPLVLDMVRFLAYAHSKGQSGPQHHLASFFKSPHGVDVHDFPRQFALLEEYIAAERAR